MLKYNIMNIIVKSFDILAISWASYIIILLI